MKQFAAALALAAGLIPAAPAANAAGTPLPIQSLSYAGTGCPQGTAGLSISNDRTVFTVIFDSDVASTGPGVPTTEATKDCAVNLNLVMPQGWRITGIGVDQRGYEQLDAGATASSRLTAALDNKVLATQSLSAAGPVARDYTSHTNVPNTRSLGRCSGGTFTVSLQTSLVLSSTGQAQITQDSIDGKVSIAPCE